MPTNHKLLKKKRKRKEKKESDSQLSPNAWRWFVHWSINAIFWPTPGNTDRTSSDSSGFSVEGTWISLSAVPQCRGWMGKVLSLWTYVNPMAQSWSDLLRISRMCRAQRCLVLQLSFISFFPTATNCRAMSRKDVQWHNNELSVFQNNTWRWLAESC